MKNEFVLKLLIEKFPNLQKELLDYDENPIFLHLVFGDVINPYIEKCIQLKKDAELVRVFSVIDDLLPNSDIYFQEVILFTVLERLVDNKSNWAYIQRFLGNHTKQLMNEN